MVPWKTSSESLFSMERIRFWVVFSLVCVCVACKERTSEMKHVFECFERDHQLRELWLLHDLFFFSESVLDGPGCFWHQVTLASCLALKGFNHCQLRVQLRAAPMIMDRMEEWQIKVRIRWQWIRRSIANRIVHPKMYLPSCCSKLVWFSFFFIFLIIQCQLVQMLFRPYCSLKYCIFICVSKKS